MAPQTSYAINQAPWAYPGQLADMMQARDIVSAIAVAAALSYGLFVLIDTSNSAAGFAELAARLPASAADITTNTGLQLGITLADQARAQNPGVATAQYPINSCVSCMKKGRVVVSAETAVVAGGKVYARFATGDNGTVIGSLGATLDTSVVGNALLPNAVWMDTTSAAGFAVVELNLV